MNAFLDRLAFVAQSLGYVSMKLVVLPPPQYVRRMAETRSRIREAEKANRKKINRRGLRGK